MNQAQASHIGMCGTSQAKECLLGLFIVVIPLQPLKLQSPNGSTAEALSRRVRCFAGLRGRALGYGDTVEALWKNVMKNEEQSCEGR